MPTSRFRKLVASLFVFTALCFGAWAETYHWVGTKNSDWNDPENWDAPDGCPDLPRPTDDIIVDDGIIYLPAIVETDDITINSLTFENPIPTYKIVIRGKLTIKEDFTLADNIHAESIGTLIVEGTLTIDSDFSNTELNLECQDLVTNADLECDSIIVSGTTTGTGTITANTQELAGTIIFSGSENQTYDADGKTFTSIKVNKDGGKLTINGTCTITSFELQKGSKTEFGGFPTIGTYSDTTAGGDITFSKGMNIQAGTETEFKTNGTITFGASESTSTTVSGKVIFGGTNQTLITEGTVDTEIVVAENTTLILRSNLTTTGDQIYTGTLEISSNSSSLNSLGVIKFNNNVTGTGSLTVSSAATLADGKTVSPSVVIAETTGAITCSGAAIFESTLENNGTINVTSSLAADSFSGSGIINLTGETTFLTTTNTSTTTNTVVLKSTNATIKGNFEFATFDASDASMSGKIISLDADVTTKIKAENLSLKGSGSDGSLLNLAGTGTFDATTLDVQYLSIGSDVKLDTYTGNLSDKNCEPSAGLTQPDWLSVIHNGWKIKDLSSFIYTWVGTSEDWGTETNWDTGFIPSTNSRIIIPVVADSKKYPVLSDSDYHGGTLSIDSGASITLRTNNLVLSGTDETGANPANPVLANAGTIIYTGTGRITNNAATPSPINDTAHGTVEYAGTGGTVNDFGTADYNNLIISGTNWQIDGECTVQNSFSIADGGTCNISNATSITAESITIADGGSCSVSAETTLKAKNFAFNGSSTNKNLTSSANVNMIFIPATANADVKIPSGIDLSFSFESTGTLHLENESTGKLVFSDSDTFNVFEYKLNFHSPVILKQDIKVQNSVTAAESITAGDTSGTSALIFQGSGEIEFNPTTDKTYQNITINDTGCSLTVNNNGYTITNFTITKATSTTFDGTPTITNLSDDTTAGNITFNNGANITNAVSLETTGNTTVKGNLSAASFSAKNLVTGADAAVNTTGTQTYGTINGTTAETQDLTLTASAVTINDNVGTTTKLKTLTINAPLTIGTTGNQISAKEIDFAGDISGSDKNLTITTAKLKSTITAGGTAEISLNQLTLNQATIIGTKNASTLSLNISEILGTSTLTFDENATQITLTDGM